MKPRFKVTPRGLVPQIEKERVGSNEKRIVQNLITLMGLRSEASLNEWMREFFPYVAKEFPVDTIRLTLRHPVQLSVLNILACMLGVPRDLLIGRIKKSDRRQKYWLSELTWSPRVRPDYINASVFLLPESKIGIRS